MRVGIYSIPATGTRFVSEYLRYIGADYSRRHVGDPPPCPEWRRILPVRNPYDCYLSHKHKGHTRSDAEFVSKWGSYIWRTQWMDAFYFPLDVPEANRLIMLQQCAQFCGIEPDLNKIWDFEWKQVGKSERDRSKEVPEEIRNQLKFAHEWYEHYTVFWGKHIRHSNNMLGEGT